MANLDQRPLTTPNPDPTAATTAALLREITGSKELGDVLVKFTREIVEQRIDGARETLGVRLDHVEAALGRVPTHAEDNTRQLRDIVEEKLKVQDRQFDNIQLQFKERDTRMEQTTRDQVKAVDAAFAAADKAIAKTEASFTKQIDEQRKSIDTVEKNASEKLGDLKDRVTIIESLTRGMTLQKTEAAQTIQQSSQSIGLVFGGASLLIALVSIGFVIFTKAH